MGSVDVYHPLSYVELIANRDSVRLSEFTETYPDVTQKITTENVGSVWEHVLELDKNFDEISVIGYGLIHLLCSFANRIVGSVDILKRLLTRERGGGRVCVDDRTELGRTSLLLVSAYTGTDSNIDIARVLIESGADVNADDIDGATALMYASKFSGSSSNTETVRLLIDHGAGVNFRNKKGKTALMYAAKYSGSRSNLKTVRTLVNSGANVNIQDTSSGATALMYASKCSGFRSNSETVSILLNSGSKFDLTDFKGRTALMFAAKSSNKDIKLVALQTLIIHGANINSTDLEGHTALMYAIGSDNLKTIGMLIKRGAKVNSTNENGWSALMFAARYRTPETAMALVRWCGADASLKNNVGYTARDLMRVKLAEQKIGKTESLVIISLVFGAKHGFGPELKKVLGGKFGQIKKLFAGCKCSPSSPEEEEEVLLNSREVYEVSKLLD